MCLSGQVSGRKTRVHAGRWHAGRTVFACFGRNCCNFWRLRGSGMWPTVTSCDSGMSAVTCLECLSACLPASERVSGKERWQVDTRCRFSCCVDMLGAGGETEKNCESRIMLECLRAAFLTRECWLLLAHENSCDIDSLRAGDGLLSAVRY
jgi:hypothetical protein